LARLINVKGPNAKGVKQLCNACFGAELSRAHAVRPCADTAAVTGQSPELSLTCQGEAAVAQVHELKWK
jgi:hypothetical protein